MHAKLPQGSVANSQGEAEYFPISRETVTFVRYHTNYY